VTASSRVAQRRIDVGEQRELEISLTARGAPDEVHDQRVAGQRLRRLGVTGGQSALEVAWRRALGEVQVVGDVVLKHGPRPFAGSLDVPGSNLGVTDAQECDDVAPGQCGNAVLPH